MKCILAMLCVLGCGMAWAGGFSSNEEMVPVRPGNVETGAPFWNRNAAKFICPPSFPFRTHWMAKRYRFTVWGADGQARVFTADKPWAPLTPVWKELPTGRTVVLCEGLSDDNVVPLVNPPRVFWKDAAFTGHYPPAARSYLEAAEKAYSFLFAFKPFVRFRETGRPDPEYDKNGYPSKTHAATICGMLDAAEVLPAHKDEAMRLATLAGEALLATSLPADTPLANWPRTYLVEEGQKCQHPESAGTVMLIYPATVGSAYLRLWKSTGEKRWLDAALRIVATYLKTRRPDGSWPLVCDEKTGAPTTPNALVPDAVMAFFRDLGQEAGWKEYDAEAGRCLAWIERNVVADWDWEGQFEDVSPDAKYANLTKHNALDVLLYRLANFPDDPATRSFATDAIRFAEDQFVFWERPYGPASGQCVFSPADAGSGGRGAKFLTPCVVEQYRCFNAIDASAAKLIVSWIAYGKWANDERALAKARAMADSMTRRQTAEGYVPTWWMEGRDKVEDDCWINCHIYSAHALKLAAETFEEGTK